VNVAEVPETSRPAPSVARPDAGASTATWLVLGALIVVGAALRFWRIGHQGYWYDEGVTVSLLHDSFGHMLGSLPHSEGTPPVYYVIGWVWARIFGFAEAGVRSLSAVAGVLVIPAMYGIGAKLVSRRAGLIAAALTAFNPFLIWYSQEARSYSLLVLFATLSLLAWVHLLSPQSSGRWIIAWGVAASLTLATHYYGVLVVAPEAAWLLWVHVVDRRVWVAVGAAAVVGCALVPLALSQTGNTAWIAHDPLGGRLGQIGPQFVLGTGAPARTWLKLGGALSLLLAGVLLAWRADVRARRAAALLGGLVVSGFVLSLLLIVAGYDEVITRNLITLLIALIALVSAGLGARRAGVLGIAGTAVLCAIGVIATVAVAVDWELQRPDWRAVAHVLETSRPAGAASAVLVENNDAFQPLDDYIRGLHALISLTPTTGASVQEVDVVAPVKGRSEALCWWGASCFLALAPLDGSIRLAGFRPVGRVLHIGQFAIYRLRSARPVVLTRYEVARAVAGAPFASYGLDVVPATVSSR
jgi:mannosyltransferase